MDNQVNSISRVDITSVTLEIFEEYQINGLPVIITGLLKNKGDCNLQYLCEKFGNQEFLFRNYGSDKYKQNKRR